MRVIGGIYGGRKIKSPKGKNTRPTSDMVREALFNILGNKVLNSTFIDVFAGTGAVGLEALSRGSKEVFFVEKDPNAYKLILQNLESLGIKDKINVIKKDALEGLKILNKKGIIFDIIFMDPPYYKNLILPCLEFIKNSALATPETIIVLQHAYNENFINELAGFKLLKQKKYGDTLLTFMAKE